MVKNSSNGFSNITALRVICVVLSLLFIPAFQFGFVSIWALVFGVLMALLFNRHLQNIIDICEPIDNKKERCLKVLDRYWLVTLELTLIGSLGAVIITFGDLVDGNELSSLDSILMKYNFINFVFDKDYIYNQDVINKFKGFSLSVFLFLFFSIFLNFKKVCKLTIFVVFVNKPDPDYSAHRWNRWLYSDMGGTFSLILVLFMNAPFYLDITSFYKDFEPFTYPMFFIVNIISLTVFISIYSSFIYELKEKHPSKGKK